MELDGSSPRGRGKPRPCRGRSPPSGLIPARAGKTASPASSWIARRAHPRAGGENAIPAPGPSPVPGSSPRGRGKLVRVKIPHRSFRLIPARAGKTVGVCVEQGFWPAHPRAGGENRDCGRERRGSAGSSPRGRGKPRCIEIYLGQHGLIPARAGKTSWTSPTSSLPWAHPRAGGENELLGAHRALAFGSSPRGRGKRTTLNADRSHVGLIPARAGKTEPSSSSPTRWRAHPRAGGENPTVASPEPREAGSSPRGRGKHALTTDRTKWAGLIPARAGKTPHGPTSGRYSGAHPRAGGENGPPDRGGPSPAGSSPRGRGKRQGLGVRRANGGLIPARAGKTSGPWRSSCQWWAHPRAGGENPTFAAKSPKCAGSSPRGRGKPCAYTATWTFKRLIPARAGKTPVGFFCRSVGAAHPRAGGENEFDTETNAHAWGSSPRGRGKLMTAQTESQPRGLIPARAGKTVRVRLRNDGPPAHPRAGGENGTIHWGLVSPWGSSPRGRGKQ